ncbi:uncharacterized protein C8Q71DRAFT_738873 [Rhodofomes roseus]|uniref:Uncharacterized protein n=1 Tax=Rhodofomes roseus TaxID=34475 RepID=A0ABQ8KSV6_9APHY|nr:uncharacterized protein C8Q71DRAFT_738873 [Rhodofomes roseus]KAH9841802.1 hypothetical protein C8Q71DRAFT_738873 [Rhodofomes roseus]
MVEEPFGFEYVERRPLDDARRAPARNAGDSLTELEGQVATLTAERNEARERAKRLQEEVEGLRRESSTGTQERLALLFERPVAEIQRHARQLLDETATRIISQLEHERDELKHQLEVAQEISNDAQAANVAAQEAKKAVDQELAASREELKRCVDELNSAKERYFAMILGLETLKEMGEEQTRLAESLTAGITVPSGPSMASYDCAGIPDAQLFSLLHQSRPAHTPAVRRTTNVQSSREPETCWNDLPWCSKVAVVMMALLIVALSAFVSFLVLFKLVPAVLAALMALISFVLDGLSKLWRALADVGAGH